MSTQIANDTIYTIKETSALTGLPASTLRYYENIGIIDPIERGATSKQRVYTEEDLNTLTSIACLSATGMPLEDMRAYLKNRDKGAQKAEEQISLLETQRFKLGIEARLLKVRQQYVDLKVAYWRAVEACNDTEAMAIAEKAKALINELQPNHKSIEK